MDGADADVPKKTSSIMSQVAGLQVAGRRSQVAGLQVAGRRVAGAQAQGAGSQGRRSQDAGMTATVPDFPSSPSTVIWAGRKA
jgi:hypothetical protein